jgi:hypothetical protein
MNPDEPPEPERDQAEAAIASVLRAELEANAAIGRCREEARAIVTEGEVQARAASERADRRLSRLRERVRSGLASALAALDAEEYADPEKVEVPSERLDRAVANLARELTTGSG